MSAICSGAIRLCRVRATRLDDLGNPSAGPNNVYVTDNPITLTATPQIEAGVDRTLVGGCDCIIASYRGNDKLKRWEFALTLGLIEPALLEMMLGASARIEGGKVAGWDWPSQLSCGAAVQPNVALEAWVDAWDEDAQMNSPTQYIRFVWPSTRWQMAPITLQNDFITPTLNGFSRSNSNWGLGIFGDLTQAVAAQGSVFYDRFLPNAVCDYQTEGLT